VALASAFLCYPIFIKKVEVSCDNYLSMLPNCKLMLHNFSALNETSSRLVVERTTGNDSAVYFCEAVSTAGTAAKTFNVTILGT